MKRLFRKIVGLVSMGRYRMVESAAEATEVGHCWLEDDRDGRPRLYLVEKAERDGRGHLLLETTLLETSGKAGLYVGITVVLAMIVAQVITLWLVLARTP